MKKILILFLVSTSVFAAPPSAPNKGILNGINMSSTAVGVTVVAAVGAGILLYSKSNNSH